MSKRAKRESLLEIRKRYFSSTKAEKQSILNEFCSNCGYNRKYAIRLINKLSQPKDKSSRKKPGGRPKKYNPPKTPFQRLLDSVKIKPIVKKQLSAVFNSLNPFLLQNSIKEQIANILKLL